MASGRHSQSQASRFGSVVFRTLFVTMLFTLLGMGIGLFAGIIAMIVYAFTKNAQPDMQIAYLRIAFPTAAAFGIIALIYNVVHEIRRAAGKQ